MSDLKMDLDTNDLLVENGDLSMVSGSDAIVQDWQQTMQLWFGEWFLDTTKGIHYKQQILVKNPNLDTIQAELVSASLEVPGIQEIIDFNFEYDSINRSLEVFMTGKDSNGQTIEGQASVSVPTDATIQGTPY